MSDNIHEELAELRGQVAALQTELAAIKRLLGLPLTPVDAHSGPVTLTVGGIRFQREDGSIAGHAGVRGQGCSMRVLGGSGRAVLELGSDGAGGIVTIANEEGTIQCLLHVGAQGGAVDLHGPEGTRRLSLLALDKGGQLAVFSDVGGLRAGLSVRDDHGSVMVAGPGGDISGLLFASELGGILTLMDGDQNPRLILPGGLIQENEG